MSANYISPLEKNFTPVIRKVGRLKNCRLLLLILLMLGVKQIANGQNPCPDLGGPDSTICPGQSVTIGTGKLSGCYYWEGSDGSKYNSATISVSPKATTSYTVTCTGANFAYQMSDNVTVYVRDIDGVSVSPKLCCYKSGEAFNKNDFNISTSPPNFKKLTITFDPSSAPNLIAIPFVQDGVQEKTITVKAKGCVKEVETQTIVTVVDKNLTREIKIARDMGGADGKGFTSLVGKVDEIINVAGKISKVAPCQFNANWNIWGAVKYGSYCCAKEGQIHSGWVGGSGGLEGVVAFECSCPFPWAPLAPVFDLFIRVDAKGIVTILGIEPTCTGIKVCAGVSGSVGIAGGVKIKKYYEAYVNARAFIEGRITVAQLKWCSDTGLDKHNGAGWIQGEVNLKAEASFLGSLWKLKYSYCLYKAP